MKKLIPALVLASLSLSVIAPVATAEIAKDKANAMQAHTQKVNLNSATVEQLTRLPGIGAKKAAAIVEYRTKIGKFKSVNDLTKVKGIGQKMIVKLQNSAEI